MCRPPFSFSARGGRDKEEGGEEDEEEEEEEEEEEGGRENECARRGTVVKKRCWRTYGTSSPKGCGPSHRLRQAN